MLVFISILLISKHHAALDSLSPTACIFLDIAKHGLCFFHLVSRAKPQFALNHEKTHFVENIVSSMIALSKLVGFLEFKWCEMPFSFSNILNLKATDYDLCFVPPTKLTDALGMLTTQNNMETVIVEVSSGAMKENTTHSIEDSLRTLECSAASLR